MPSGTTIVGNQLLLEGVARGDQNISVSLYGDVSTPPSRIGYFYLGVFGPAPGGPFAVTRAGVLWAPAQIIKIPHFYGLTAGSLRLYVEWNRAGLTWDAFSFN